MSFSAQLEFGSDTYVILDMDYEFVQPMDAQNRPNGKPKGGIISISVESSKKNELMEWMLATDMKKTGVITVFKRDAAGAALKTIKFTDAFCTRYREHYSSHGSSPMTLSLTISAGQININGKHSLANVWSDVKTMAESGGSMTATASFTAADLNKDLIDNPEHALKHTNLNSASGNTSGAAIAKDIDTQNPGDTAKKTFGNDGDSLDDLPGLMM